MAPNCEGIINNGAHEIFLQTCLLTCIQPCMYTKSLKLLPTNQLFPLGYTRYHDCPAACKQTRSLYSGARRPIVRLPVQWPYQWERQSLQLPKTDFFWRLCSRSVCFWPQRLGRTIKTSHQENESVPISVALKVVLDTLNLDRRYRYKIQVLYLKNL